MVLKYFLLVLIASLALAQNSPYDEGPYKVGHFSVIGFNNPGLERNIEIWAPDVEGEFPVIYFLSGFAGLIEPIFYSQSLSRLASHGFVVVCPWSVLFPTTQFDAQWVIDFDLWCQDNLLGKLQHDGINENMAIDFTTTFLSGHSSGNHVIVNYLKLGCHNVKAMAMISPVDGVDPFGLIDDFCITPGEKLEFELPTLVLSAGLDSVPGFNAGDFVPACAPEDLSNRRFYDALKGRAWLNNATAYGHIDVLDAGAFSDIGELFGFCADGHLDTEVDDKYRHFVIGQMVSLFKGVTSDCLLLGYLSNPALAGIDVQVIEQGEGCPAGTCI